MKYWARVKVLWAKIILDHSFSLDQHFIWEIMENTLNVSYFILILELFDANCQFFIDFYHYFAKKLSFKEGTQYTFIQI